MAALLTTFALILVTDKKYLNLTVTRIDGRARGVDSFEWQTCRRVDGRRPI